MSKGSRRQLLLAETEWLAEHLDDPAIRIADIRGIIKPPDQPKPWYEANRKAYLEAHIRGAVFIDWLQDIVEPDAPVRMTVAGPERFGTLMSQLGIGDEHTVIVYDDDGGHIAARLWWVLNYYGHPAVKILNGGFTKWVAEGRPVEAEVPKHPPALFTPKVQPEWRVSNVEVRAVLGDPMVRLVDCRDPRQYRGEVTRGERKGRIPGAVNLPIKSLVEGEHKTFKADEELRRIYEAAGVTPDQQVITYCNAGVSASVGLFALKLLGYLYATNFAGSWYEWERDPENPTEMGS